MALAQHPVGGFGGFTGVQGAMTGLRLDRRIRSDAPFGGQLSNTLGKSLVHSQVAHATAMTDLGSVATRPIVAKRNQMLSATGGLTRDIMNPFTSARSVVKQLSHHDHKLHHLTNSRGARLQFNSTRSKSGL